MAREVSRTMATAPILIFNLTILIFLSVELWLVEQNSRLENG